MNKYEILTPNGDSRIVEGFNIAMQGNMVVIRNETEVSAMVPDTYLITKKEDSDE